MEESINTSVKNRAQKPAVVDTIWLIYLLTAASSTNVQKPTRMKPVH